MADKIQLGVFFGGQSAEHQVSIWSTRNVVEVIDREKFEITLVGITQTGLWNLLPVEAIADESDDMTLIERRASKKNLTLVPDDNGAALLEIGSGGQIAKLDVIFPVLHGPCGEDGSIQGVFQLAGVPFVGCGVMSSALCMDKEMTKKVCREAGIEAGKFLTFYEFEKGNITFDQIRAEFGLPFYVKPCHLGSSVGITRVNDEGQFAAALDLAFSHDSKIVIEANIVGREIECAVLGNDRPDASIPGEIIASDEHGFYSYDAKYIDETGASLHAPATLNPDELEAVQDVALRAFKALECRGMARVDVFLTSGGSVVLNEVNTIPGFTNISMYPRLWEISGINYADLVNKLIELALK